MSNQSNKPKVDARALVAQLNQESAALLEREIVAPMLPGGKIKTRLGKMIYEFKPQSNFVGWGLFRPVNEREAEVVGEALPWQRAAYLEQFPALRVILLWPDPNPKFPGTWWALPFNAGDARQRFGLSNGEPVPVFLCDPLNGAQAFERVIARVDGKTLWFDGSDLLADPTYADWLRDRTALAEPPETEIFPAGLAGSERMALIFWQIRQFELAEQEAMRHEAIRQEAAQQEQAQREAAQQATQAQRNQNLQGQRNRHTRPNPAEAQMPAVQHLSRSQQRRWSRQQHSRNSLENRLQRALSKAEATLHSYSETFDSDGSPTGIVVEWSEQGQTYRYRSLIDRQLNVVSSGICLSGRDHDFDLTSLVNVMTRRNYEDD